MLLNLLLVSTFVVSAAMQHHHEAPVREVPLAAQLGEIDFPNSGSAAAQQHFLRGVLLLHSFEYRPAALAFAEARKVDPSFAMAYWGEAMTHNHPIWGEQDRAAARAILASLPKDAPRTEREKGYLAALALLYGGEKGEGEKKDRDAAYSAAMGELADRHPEDLDARAFYALSLLGLGGETRDTANYMRAAAVAEEIYDKNRRHPGAIHYLIHAYDDPIHAPLGLRAARLYAKVAPAASHAQHMPSHIFFAMGMWDEANASNTDSLKTARDQEMGGYHPLHWLEHGYLQVGEDEKAASLVSILESDVAKNPTKGARAHLAMARATWLVETRGRGPATMAERVDHSAMGSIVGFTAHDFARGLAAIERKELDQARAARRDLGQLIEAGRGRLSKGSDVASRYDAVTETDIKTAEVMALALDAALAYANGSRDEAVRLARRAAEAEDALTFEFGPPATVKPAWELAGELLLAMDRKSEAADAFRRAQSRYPNRRLTSAGLRRAEAR